MPAASGDALTSLPRTSYRAGAAVLSGLFVLMLGFGLLGSLIGVRGSEEGFSTVSLGLIGSAYYVGFLAGGVTVPGLIGAVGHIRVYAALASVNAAAILIMPFAIHAVAWGAVRLVVGVCLSGLYLVAESWLNAVSTNRTRGRMLSIYLVVVNVGVGLGQFLLVAAGTEGVRPFAVASGLYSLSILPLTLTSTSAPSHSTTRVSLPIREVVHSAPLGPVTSIASGLGASVTVVLAPVYGIAVGMDVHAVALFVFAAMIGGVALQWPIGALSDRISRRKVILLSAAGAGLVALVGIALPGGGAGDYAVLAGFTALSFPLYSLAITHTNDAIAPDLIVSASAVLIMSYGLASIVGPYAASLAMEAAGPDGFWAALAVSGLFLVPYGVYRLAKRPTLASRFRHRPLPPEPSPDAAVLLDEREERS